MFVHREVELTRKLELGKEEYTKKATEANDLSRQLKKVQVCVCVCASSSRKYRCVCVCVCACVRVCVCVCASR